MKFNFIKLVMAMLLVGQFVYAQKEPSGVQGPNGFVRCATVEADAALQSKYPNQTMSKEDFEEWLAPKVEQYKAEVAAGTRREGVLTIPVVIHVIHDGDAVNTPGNISGENISYAQAVSQVNVLNQDYRRIAGTPGAGTSGYGLGVDTEIEFCLATRDPNGFPTDGVNRVNLGQESWARTGIESTVKPQTIWDPEKYLNMWSIRFSDSNLLGYAQFPTGSGLPGVPGGGTASTDGVVSNYNAFGTIAEDDGSFTMNSTYNLGRTMSHEVGHWLGLRHIWGDGGCSDPDYCDDTPESDQANYNCNQVTHCGSIDMLENYMDYTNDACMDTFTADQKARMIAVMENSPRRETLPTSDGCSAPMVFQNEAGLTLSEYKTDCDGSILINVTVQNFGEQNLTSVEFEYGTDANTNTYTWTGNIDYLQTEMIELPGFMAVEGTNNVSVNIVSTNGSNDEYVDNNSATFSTDYTPVASYATNDYDVVLQMDNYGSETTWELVDSEGTVISNGGPYTNETNPDPIEGTWVLEDGCYTFTIYDSYGDGICCSYGEGFITITEAATGNLVFEAAEFDSEASVSFRVGNMGVNDVALNSFAVYPNPAKSVINLVTDRSQSIQSYVIYNANGQVVLSNNRLNASNAQEINVSGLKPGVYFIEANGDNKKQMIKFIKE